MRDIHSILVNGLCVLRKLVYSAVLYTNFSKCQVKLVDSI